MTEEEEKVALEAKAAADKKAPDEADAVERERLSKLTAEELLKENATLRNENASRRMALKEAQEKEDKVAAAQKEAADKAAAEKGEFKTLYEDLKAEQEGAAGRVGAMEASLQKILDAEMVNIPEEMHALIPAGDVTSKLDWIAAAKVAKLFVDDTRAPEYRGTGEGMAGTLEAKLADAQKEGNLPLIISLKKQIFDKAKH